MRPRTPNAVGCIENELQMIDLKDELAELERQLAQAEKTLPFVPPMHESFDASGQRGKAAGAVADLTV